MDILPDMSFGPPPLRAGCLVKTGPVSGAGVKARNKYSVSNNFFCEEFDITEADL
jgi:hypothetical protein